MPNHKLRGLVKKGLKVLRIEQEEFRNAMNYLHERGDERLKYLDNPRDNSPAAGALLEHTLRILVDECSARVDMLTERNRKFSDFSLGFDRNHVL